jgi:hypothetical protein
MTDTHTHWPVRLTRKQAPLFLTDQGYPIKGRQFEKAALPGAADPPVVDRWFGGRALYKPEDLIAWAERRVSKAPPPRRPPVKRPSGRPRKVAPPVEHTGPDAA